MSQLVTWTVCLHLCSNCWCRCMKMIKKALHFCKFVKMCVLCTNSSWMMAHVALQLVSVSAKLHMSTSCLPGSVGPQAVLLQEETRSMLSTHVGMRWQNYRKILQCIHMELSLPAEFASQG